MSDTEQLVLDAVQRATLHHEMPAAREPHRVATGGSVERLGHRGPPVHHHGLAIVVGDRQSTDVETLDSDGRPIIDFLGQAIDATEHQGGVTQIQIGESLHQRFVDGIALEPILEGSTRA